MVSVSACIDRFTRVNGKGLNVAQVVVSGSLVLPLSPLFPLKLFFRCARSLCFAVISGLSQRPHKSWLL